MQVTLIGIIVYLIGSVLLFKGRIETMLAFVMLCTMMSGSATFILSSLGGSSVPPAHLALAFLGMRVLMPSAENKPLMQAMKANAPFIIFTAYGVAGAMILPRLFANQINVVPMKVTVLRSLFDSLPLAFSSQNITSSIYLIGSLFFSIFTYVAVRQPHGATRVVKLAAIIGFTHAALGIASIALPHDLWMSATTVVRNGSYAQTDQSIEGFIRMSGIQPEPSAYASYGFCWFGFTLELWLRDIRPRLTGLAAAALGFCLVLSTSSTAYACLASYTVILTARMFIFPGFFRLDKMAWLVGAIMVATTGTAMLMVLKPALADQLAKILMNMTVNKGSSDSGLQRAYWAKQGFAAFKVSYGLGIGAGSFRSSSNITAIIGSMGVIGSASFLAYFFAVFKPLRNTTFMHPIDPVDGVGVAASWAAVCALIVGSIGSPAPDPGSNFSIFAGIALGLRSLKIVRLPARIDRPLRQTSAPAAVRQIAGP